jgi:hypothetical protein
VIEYIINPRRAVRAPSRCAAKVNAPDKAFGAETEDLSPLGCQLVAPGAMARGLPLRLAFSNPRVTGSLQVEGKVAWGSSQPPWRIGVAFDDTTRHQSERWFAQLVAAYPGLAALRRVPDRLPVDATLYLGPPPTFLLDFTEDEVQVLRHVAGGITVAALRSRLAASWNAAQRAIFSLLARGALTVSRSAAAHTMAWKKVMADLDVDFVSEEPPLPRLPPIIERMAPGGVPRVEATDRLPRPTPVPGRASAPPRSPAATPIPAPAPPAVGPGLTTAGTGWRGEARTRSAAAQECVDLGRMELEAGRMHSALAHLRRAMQLAPGDAEVAVLIGRAMSRG